MSEETQNLQSPSGYQTMPPAEDEIDLVDLIRVLWGQKWLVVGIAFLVLVMGGVYGFLQPPVYKVETLLVPTQTEGKGPSVPGGLGGLASMAGVNLGGGGGGTLDEALATLKSRRFLTAYIEEKGLLPALFSKKWDAEAGEWDVEKKEQLPSPVDGYKTFKGMLDVSREQESGLVTLSMTWKNGTQAAQWANELVERLNRKMREEEIERLNRKVAFLRQQVEQTNISGVRQALFSIMESQLKSKTMAKTQKQYVFRVIDPAVPPEKGDTQKTSLKLILALSGVLGGFLGIFAAFFWHFIRTNFLAGKEEKEASGS